MIDMTLVDDIRRHLPMRGAVTLAHHFLRERLKDGGMAVDATCGNGNDTLLLARLVGEHGMVVAVDADPRAVAATEGLLESEGLAARVRLHCRGHEDLRDIVPGAVDAVVFNLGYLPGAAGGRPTAAATTLQGLEGALELLAPGGVLLICIYTGHAGGAAEADAVGAWGGRLPPREFNVWQCRQLNRSDVAPYLVLVERNPLSGSR